MDSKNSKGRNKIFLPLFFIGPAVLCLAFYYFYIRKPFTQNQRPVFKSLPHFGKFIGIDNNDSIYEKISSPRIFTSEGELLETEKLNFKIYNFPLENDEKNAAMMSANAFRIQKKIDHIKNFQFISLASDSIAQIGEKLNNERRKVHSGTKHWDYYYTSYKEYNTLRKSITEILPHFNADSLNSYFILADHKNQIRGYYNGTSVSSVNRMAQEVVVINGEYKFKNKKIKNGN